MDENAERERCIAILEALMKGASLETRRVLTRAINEIRRGGDPNDQPPNSTPRR